MSVSSIAGIVMMFGVAVSSAGAQSEHATSREYNVALGVECTHCHVASQFADTSKPTFAFAQRMDRMVRAINDGPLRDRAITCWSCHRGRAIPPRLPRADWERIATSRADVFSGRRAGLDLAMSVYSASLGVDCSHCHTNGDWSDPSMRAHQTVQLMNTIFDLIPQYFDEAVRMPRTQCFMCHQGHVTVERTAPRGVGR
jgi:hypothetical protein